MSNTIDQFKNNILDGGARPNQFRILMSPPASIVPDSESNLTERIAFLCKAASLPPSILASIQVPIRGRFVKMPGEFEYPAWSIQVYNANNFQLRRFFEDWVSNITDRNSFNIRHRLRNNVVDIQAVQLDRAGEPISSYKLVGAWPQSIGEIRLGHDMTNTVEEFSVTFQYQYWEREDIASTTIQEPSKQDKTGLDKYIPSQIGTIPVNAQTVEKTERLVRQGTDIIGKIGF